VRRNRWPVFFIWTSRKILTVTWCRCYVQICYLMRNIFGPALSSLCQHTFQHVDINIHCHYTVYVMHYVHINCLRLKQHLLHLLYISCHVIISYARVGAIFGESHIYCSQQPAVNTCSNVSVKCRFLIDPLFFPDLTKTTCD
jgi:hypothetical protein